MPVTHTSITSRLAAIWADITHGHAAIAQISQREMVAGPVTRRDR